MPPASSGNRLASIPSAAPPARTEDKLQENRGNPGNYRQMSGLGMSGLGIGALQLMLDRGELKDWFYSSEIWVEATLSGLGFYLFTVHTVTTDERSFLNRDLLKSANFLAGTVLMFCGGLIMTGTNALLQTMLQNLMNFPALTTGLVTMPRGFGSMAAMFLVAPLITRIDNRLIILFGLLMTSAAMWQMSQF